jgi:hypothetical protein
MYNNWASNIFFKEKSSASFKWKMWKKQPTPVLSSCDHNTCSFLAGQEVTLTLTQPSHKISSYDPKYINKNELCVCVCVCSNGKGRKWTKILLKSEIFKYIYWGLLMMVTIELMHGMHNYILRTSENNGIKQEVQ